MSLAIAAKHLASHGRGPDTELVHMTKGEINSLQTLAKANGGSLTINPHTGLPEAGFLSNILPTVIGGAAMYFSGGAINPATIGMITGGLQYARTGSLNKGLMAGLGAYGGAGLAGGLMGAGAAEIGKTAATGAVEEAGKQGLTGEAYNQSIQNSVADKMAGASNWDKLSTGFANPSTAVNAMGGGAGMLKTGLAAAAPMLMQTTTQQPQITGDNVMPQRLQYNAGRATDAQGNTVTPMPDVPAYGSGMGQNFGREQNYFPNAGYQNITPEQAKQIRGYAGGGPVEAMSNANAVGANTGFPMADINKPAYATPWQTPVSQNVVQGSADTGVNSMTGEQNEFAKGGVTTSPNVFDYGDQGQNFGAERIYASPTGLPKIIPPVAESLGYEGYKAMPVSGGSSDAPAPTAPNTRGSPTGSVGWDLVDAVANQPLSPIAAAIAQHAIDNYSPIGQYSVNAVNGMDKESDDATARGFGVSVSDRGIGSGFGNDATSAGYTNGSDMASDSYSSNSDSGDSGGGDSGGGDSGGEANGGLAPHFPRHMADGGLNLSGEYSRNLKDELDSAYAKAERSNDKSTMRSVKGETALRERIKNPKMYAAGGGLSAAASHLGDYSDGGRLLKGPGDGVSDSIPAMIGNKRPARLADGEFVVPARIVSELGNGSTEAGARKLYAMLDRVQAARKKSIGKGKVAKNSRADKLLPA